MRLCGAIMPTVAMSLVAVALLSCSHHLVSEGRGSLPVREVLKQRSAARRAATKMSPKELARQMKRTADIMKKEARLSHYVMTAQREFRKRFLRNETQKRDRVLACMKMPSEEKEKCYKAQERQAQHQQKVWSDQAVRIWKDAERRASRFRAQA